MCGNVNIPEKCQSEHMAEQDKVAKFVVELLDNKGCIIIQDSPNWKFDIKNDAQEKSLTAISSDNNIYTLTYKFICSPDNVSQEPEVQFFDNGNTFIITKYENCKEVEAKTDVLLPYGFSVMNALYTLILAIVLCFLGLKVYKEYIWALALYTAVGLCFNIYIQFTIVSKTTDFNFALFLLAFVISAVFVAIMTVVSFMIPVIVGIAVCYACAFELTTVIFASFENFNPKILLAVLFMAFAVPVLYLFWKTGSYYMIFTTSVIGSFLLLNALTQAGILSPVDFEDEESNKVKNLLLFIPFAVGGAVFQMFFMKPKEDMTSEADGIKGDLELNQQRTKLFN